MLSRQADRRRVAHGDRGVWGGVQLWWRGDNEFSPGKFHSNKEPYPSPRRGIYIYGKIFLVMMFKYFLHNY